LGERHRPGRGADELLTFFTFPKAQWTQGSLPSEDAALVLLFSLVASGQIRLRRIDGWRKITAVLGQHLSAA
jgi:hypothetical protein